MENNRNKYLIKNTIIFTIGNIGTKLINFLIIPLYSYVLSTEEYGQIDLIFTVCTLLIPILTMNIYEAVQRFSLDKNINHSLVFTNSCLVTLAASIIALLLIPIGKRFLGFDSLIYILYGYIVANSFYMTASCFLRGLEQLVKYSFCNLLLAVLICAFNFIFLVVFHHGIKGYFFAYFLSYFIVTVVIIVIGDEKKYIDKRSLNVKFSKQMMVFSIALVPNSLLWWVINSSDRIMISGFGNTAQNGLYAMAYKLPSLLSTVSTIFMQAWGFSAVKTISSKDGEEYQRNVFEGLISFMIITAVFMLFILKPAIKLLLAKPYYESWKYSPFLIIGFVFVSLASFAGTTYYVTKDSKRQMFSAVGGAIINIILNIIFIPKYGAMGAAIATCISYFAVFMYRLLDTKKTLDLQFFRKRNLANFCILFLAALFVYLKNEIYIWLEAILLLVLMFVNYGIIKDFFLICKNAIKKEDGR